LFKSPSICRNTPAASRGCFSIADKGGRDFSDAELRHFVAKKHKIFESDGVFTVHMDKEEGERA